MKSRKQKWIAPAWCALIALAAISGSACSKSEQAEAGSLPAAAAAPSVAVARVKSEDLARTLALTAEFKPYQEVDVMAKVAGYVKQINVDIGDRVTQGQLLATLEVPEMADDQTRANAAIDRSQADVKRAQDEVNRAKAAHDIADLSYKRLLAVSQKQPGLVAQQEIDDAQSKALVAETQISSANSALQAALEQVQVNKADLAKVQTLIDYTRVTAPFTGVVTKRYADTGSMIQAGTASHTQASPVVRLSENKLLRLILPVPESAVSTVHVGQQVEVRVPSLNRTFPGRVARFDHRLSLETRTMDTEVDVENPSLVLLPGMYAEVDLTLAQRNKALAVPVNAVDMDAQSGGRAATGHVAVVTPNNRVELRKIELGIETADDVEVRSGLNEGDMVVIGSRSGLQPGQEVQPKLTVLAQSVE